MQSKIYFLFVIFLLIVVRSTSIDLFNRKGGSVLDYKRYDHDDDDIDQVKHDRLNDDWSQLSTDRRNRYSPYGSPSNNHRSRSRWPSSYNDRLDSNNRSPYGYGQNSNGPSCHSLLDIQYPLFSDICGAVPQARYSLPNLFGHLERWQIAQVLDAALGPLTPTSANPTCTRSLRLLLCPLLFPPCPTRYEAPPVLPCQPFCRVVKNQCAAPSLDLLPCDLLPPTSELCPMNPSPYSSLLSSFAQTVPQGLPPSALSSILAQSAFSSGFPPSNVPPSPFSSLLSPSPFQSRRSPLGVPSSPLNQRFNAEPFMGDSLTPILVDFPPLQLLPDYRPPSRYFPTTRSATERV